MSKQELIKRLEARYWYWYNTDPRVALAIKRTLAEIKELEHDYRAGGWA